MEMKGISGLSVTLGYLLNKHSLVVPASATVEPLTAVHAWLGREGRLPRSYVAIAAPLGDVVRAHDDVLQ
jgi:hypothetical protein